MFFQLQLLFGILSQKVSDFLIVNLKVGGMHEIFHVFTGIYGFENVFERTGYNATLRSRILYTLHGKGFPTTGLSVGKYRSIVTFKNSLKNTDSD